MYYSIRENSAGTMVFSNELVYQSTEYQFSSKQKQMISTGNLLFNLKFSDLHITNNLFFSVYEKIAIQKLVFFLLWK